MSESTEIKTAVDEREDQAQKLVLRLLLAGGVLILLFCAAMLIDFNRIITVNRITLAGDSPVVWALDDPKFGAHHVTITGWALVPLEPLLEFDTAVLLQDITGGRILQLPTTTVERKELNDLYTDGIDYSPHGFLAKASTGRLHLDTTRYRLILKYFNNDHQFYIDTGQIIGGGE